MFPAAKRALVDISSHKYLHVLCIITIALSVFIVSAFTLFYINATEMLDAWQKGVRIIAYLNDDVKEPQQAALMETIGNFKGAEDVVFIPKEAAFEDLKRKIGEQSSLLEGLDKNPLPNALEIGLADAYRRLADIEALAARIAALSGVADVEYAEKWLHRFIGVYTLFKVTGLVLVVIFFTATLLIVANTIRLIMYARGEEIEIMRIVGADERFIKYPLYLEALIQGFFGGIFGLALLYLAFIFTMPNFKSEALFSFFEIRLIPLGFSLCILLCSMVIGWVGCVFSIRRFLKR